MSNKQTLDNVFFDMTEFSELVSASRHAEEKKRYRDEVLRFNSDCDANLLEIQSELRAGTAKIGPHRKHWVTIPKKRLVMALPYKSRIIQWTVYQRLNPFYDKLMIEDSYACRVGKGSLAAAKRLQYWLRLTQKGHKQWYALKIDISKYFYRVDHEILLRILSDRIKDKQLMSLLKNIIDGNGERFGLPRFMGPVEAQEYDWLGDVGMPIGNLTSQLFANIYLNELDHFAKHKLKIRKYARYMDDIIILAPDKETANAWKAEIERFLKVNLHLDLNKKTAIFPAKRIEFVGYIVTAKSLKLRKQTARRIKSAFRGICDKYFSGDMTQEQFDRRIASYKGMIKHCNSKNLKKRLNEIYKRKKKKHEQQRNYRRAMQDLYRLSQNCFDTAKYPRPT